MVWIITTEGMSHYINSVIGERKLMKALMAGGGFGGMTTALKMNAAGFDLESLDAKSSLMRR